MARRKPAAKVDEKGPDLSRLCAAMQRARLSLRRYRANRREAVREYVGHWWSEEGTDHTVPLNLLSLYVSVVGRNLIAKNPRVLLSTWDRSNKAVVSAMETWANQEIEQLRLANTLQRVVLDALFSIGIAKVALASPAESAQVGWNLPAGRPFCERVDLDDFVYDVHARDFAEAGFIGHRYRVPLDVVKDDPLYGPQRKKLAASTDEPYNLEGDERLNVLGRGLYATNMEEHEDYIDLWEVYLPRHRLVLTLADDYLSGANLGAEGEPLRTQKWLGPDGGPYHFLSYGVVPGNAMPKGPVQDLKDLHDAVNHIFRKLIRQAERQKEVVFVQGGAGEDGDRLIRTSDGEATRCDNPEKLHAATWGGPNQQNFALGIQLKDLFSWMGGNLDMMGGLSPQSKTLGQDELLSQNASRTLSDMQDRTVDFTSGVLKGLCWYWYHDPNRVMRAKEGPQGLPEYWIVRQVTPQQRQQARFEDLQLRVDPYSMQHQTPQSRLQAINQVVTQIVLPMMTIMVQQGMAFDVNAYLEKVGRYLDMPDLAEILTIQEPPQQGSDPPDAGPVKPASTTRQYVRQNMPGRTTQGNDMNLVNTMMGANGQQQNGAAGAH